MSNAYFLTIDERIFAQCSIEKLKMERMNKLKIERMNKQKIEKMNKQKLELVDN